MITKYYDFINESNKASGITNAELKLLKKYEIKNYRFNPETKMIDVDGDIYLASKHLEKLPKIRFGKINGYFYCYDNNLTSLEYCPTSVTGNFYCSDNKLTSLEYCPTSVTGDFYCSYNQLTSIEYYPLSLINGEIYSDIESFGIILDLVKSKPEVYRPLIESKNKIRFHQQIMRDDPSRIPKYANTSIPLPPKRTII